MISILSTIADPNYIGIGKSREKVSPEKAKECISLFDES